MPQMNDLTGSRIVLLIAKSTIAPALFLAASLIALGRIDWVLVSVVGVASPVAIFSEYFLTRRR